MKKTTLILLLLLTLKNANATPELDVFGFRGEHITMGVWFRFFDPVEYLFFKSLTENLDGFIDSLKQEGKLSRGKIDFSIQTAIWMGHDRGIEMYRWRGGYFCRINALHQPITQDYMARIIAYFASDDWESFVYDCTRIPPDVALRIFNQRIDTITVSHYFPARRVMEVNDVAVYFKNGRLVAKDAHRVYGEIRRLLPFAAGERTFVTVGETIYVVESGEIINRIQVMGYAFSSTSMPRAEVFPKWVNFSTRFDYFLSYSIEQNRFFRLGYEWESGVVEPVGDATTGADFWRRMVGGEE